MQEKDGGINDFSDAIIRFFDRSIDQSFLRETGSNDISCQVAKPDFIIRLDSASDINIKPGMMPGKHILKKGQMPYLFLTLSVF
ncbi:hypothetical protein [uncultured Desulfobacter sp.]|uniref:hypothetical protein n=1 Tax=uncultured Desulfobacter sp. TaxID=240139 RepID=UPI0029F4EA70|nr:hypothetical protein [uncultured Desulfobacter sp.]